MLEELELEEIFDYLIEEVEENLYHVTFQEKENGNNKIVMSVQYTQNIGDDLLDDEQWEEDVEVLIHERHGVGPGLALMMLEELCITIDEDYFDSDDDDETLSQPRTPPAIPSRSLQVPPLPIRHR
jgi:hypothetical protein